MISCDSAQLLFSDFHENTISTTNREQLEEHLSVCPACQRVFAQTKQVLSDIGRFAKIEVSDSFDKDLALKIKAIGSSDSTTTKSLIRSTAIGAAAAGLLFVAFNTDSAGPGAPEAGSSAGMNGMNSAPVTAVAQDSIALDSLQQKNASDLKESIDKNIQMVGGKKDK
jgi:anti-sigma factor RsiW